MRRALTSAKMSRASSACGVFPKLPMLSPFDFNPIVGDIATVEELTNVQLPSTMGYDAVRARAFGNLNNLVPPAQGEMLVQHRRVKVPEDKEPPEPP